VFLANHVANRASRTQGEAFFSTCVRVFPGEVPRVPEGLCMHLAPLWGLVFRALGMSLEEMQRLFLWSSARGVLSAGVRLGLVGTYEAQRMLGALEPALDEVASRCGSLGADDLAQPAPLLDLFTPRTIGCTRGCSSPEGVSRHGPRRRPHPRRPPGHFHDRERPMRRDTRERAFTVGVGGPVGSGKTALVLALCRLLRDRLSLGVVTNDIFTREDAEFLVRNEALPTERSGRWRPAVALTRRSARTSATTSCRSNV
jgi:hypothetical protein